MKESKTKIGQLFIENRIMKKSCLWLSTKYKVLSTKYKVEIRRRI